MNALRAAERSATYELQTAAPPISGEAFNLMAAAPQGVAKLRELILALALRGRLVDQDPAEAAAGHLLASSRLKWRQLMDEGTIKHEWPAAPITAEEKRFLLPAGWVWCRIVDTAQYINGLAFKPSDWGTVGRPIIRIQNLSGRSADYHRTAIDVDPSVIVKQGDVLVSWSATLDAFIWTGEEGVLNQHIFRVTPSPLLDRQFLFWLLKGSIQELAASDHAHGLVMSHINRGPFLAHAVAIPPLAEQRRIVARVEELMGLCDELETHGRLQDEQHAQLVSTLFDALVASASPEELAANWQRVASHFDLLLDRPEAVDALEQTLLQLAVRGLLVPQDPADEPAARILQAIPSAKAKRGVSSAGKRYFATRGEPCFKLPTGWEAVGLSDLCTVGGGATPSKNNPDYWGGEVPWVSPKDMKVDEIGDSQDHVTAKALCETRLPLVATHSLLIVVRGMILAHSFPVAVTTREVALNQDMKSLTPPVDGLSAFLALVLKGFTPEILSLVGRSTHGTCKLESDKLFGFAFGLPPLAEQHRIVARVEALRGLCVDLRQRLQQARATQSNLANALAAQAIA